MTNGIDADADADAGPDAADDPDGTETGGTPIDPADLPFGGYVSWGVQNTFAIGDADFYEIEYPDDPDYEPSGVELPVAAPVTEDTWTVDAEQPDPDPKAPEPPEPTITDLEVSRRSSSTAATSRTPWSSTPRPASGTWASTC